MSQLNTMPRNFEDVILDYSNNIGGFNKVTINNEIGHCNATAVHLHPGL